MSFNTTLMEHEVRLSDSAAAQMAQIVSSAEDNVEGIRVFVSGGGCSGMTYGMTYAEAVSKCWLMLWRWVIYKAAILIMLNKV